MAYIPFLALQLQTLNLYRGWTVCFSPFWIQASITLEAKKETFLCQYLKQRLAEAAQMPGMRRLTHNG